MCKEQKVRDETKSSGVTVVLYALWLLLWSITVQNTRTNVIYLFYTIQIQMVYWRIFGACMKKEKQLCWHDLTWIWRHLCVCPLIDHGQQPMKIYTEVLKNNNNPKRTNLKKLIIIHNKIHALIIGLRRNKNDIMSVW